MLGQKCWVQCLGACWGLPGEVGVSKFLDEAFDSGSLQ